MQGKCNKNNKVMISSRKTSKTGIRLAYNRKKLALGAGDIYEPYYIP